MDLQICPGRRMMEFSTLLILPQEVRQRHAEASSAMSAPRFAK